MMSHVWLRPVLGASHKENLSHRRSHTDCGPRKRSSAEEEYARGGKKAFLSCLSPIRLEEERLQNRRGGTGNALIRLPVPPSHAPSKHIAALSLSQKSSPPSPKKPRLLCASLNRPWSRCCLRNGNAVQMPEGHCHTYACPHMDIPAECLYGWSSLLSSHSRSSYENASFCMGKSRLRVPPRSLPASPTAEGNSPAQSGTSHLLPPASAPSSAQSRHKQRKATAR